MTFVPRRTGKAPETIDLTGKLLPWGDDEMPVYMGIHGSPHLYVPLFSSKEKLEEMLTRSGIAWNKIKEVQDGREFKDSFPRDMEGQQVILILDPHYTEQGTVRYIQVLED